VAQTLLSVKGFLTLSQTKLSCLSLAFLFSHIPCSWQIEALPVPFLKPMCPGTCLCSGYALCLEVLFVNFSYFCFKAQSPLPCPIPLTTKSCLPFCNPMASLATVLCPLVLWPPVLESLTLEEESLTCLKFPACLAQCLVHSEHI
jgi:hypothetical protein